jgi:hypothetical protein
VAGAAMFPRCCCPANHAPDRRWRRDESLRRTAEAPAGPGGPARSRRAGPQDLATLASWAGSRPRTDDWPGSTGLWQTDPTAPHRARPRHREGATARPPERRDNSTPTPWVTCGTAREETTMQTLDASTTPRSARTSPSSAPATP